MAFFPLLVIFIATRIYRNWYTRSKIWYIDPLGGGLIQIGWPDRKRHLLRRILKETRSSRFLSFLLLVKVLRQKTWYMMHLMTLLLVLKLNSKNMARFGYWFTFPLLLLKITGLVQLTGRWILPGVRLLESNPCHYCPPDRHRSPLV